jgi:Tfp pilus assembly protein PilX
MTDTTCQAPAARPRLRARRGFAMALTLGAIVVIGLMIAGVFFISGAATRTGRDAMLQERAFRHAEAGLAQTITEWRADSTVALANGQSWLRSAVPIPNVPAAQSPRVTVTRLNSDLFQVVSAATIGEAGGAKTESRRQVSQLVRMVGPTFNVRGALTARGNTRIGGSSLIDGNDQNPAGWACDAPGASLPGIAIPSSGDISTSGCKNYSCVSGNPKVLQDPIAGHDSTYFNYGDFDWAGLVAAADIKITTGVAPAPVVTGGKCDVTLQSNWGDVRRLLPSGACESYFPIIYFPGSAKLTGGTGQGILLVEGDLEVQGQFKFYGPVIVKGRLKTAGTGGHFNGAVMASNVDLEENSVLGNAVVNYSSCAIEKAIQSTARARPVIQRGWAEM